MSSTIEISNKQASYLTLSDTKLLGKLIGVRQARKLYRGTLASVFTSDDKALVALELVKRWLSEEIKQGSALSAPAAVRDFLKIHFVGREPKLILTCALEFPILISVERVEEAVAKMR